MFYAYFVSMKTVGMAEEVIIKMSLVTFIKTFKIKQSMMKRLVM